MNQKTESARYGAAAYTDQSALLPNLFPRLMGPNCGKYLQEVVESGLATNLVARFEKAFAAGYGVKHCIATPGCTPALHVLAAAFPFQPGDEIIVSSVTDYGTLCGLLTENYIPVFADTAPGTVNISAETIAPRITDRTRAILVVHKTGLLCDMDAINRLAAKHNLIVYEDACQSVFGKYKGNLAGTLSKAAGFSFDPEKTMGSDTGGCILTNDDDLAQRARFIGQSRGAANQPGFGRAHSAKGYAFRMAQSVAAISLAQLETIHENVGRRDKMARLLTKMLADIPGVTPLPIPDYVDVYSCWMIGFSIEPRVFKCAPDEFAAQCAREGIPGAGLAQYYLMPEALKFLQNQADRQIYPFSRPPAVRAYHYGPETCPAAHAFLKNFIRWCTFSEKYEEAHCQIAADIVRRVAARNR
jgi:dTDP-4-amino-4,6-dideoxygalactose transaminase